MHKKVVGAFPGVCRTLPSGQVVWLPYCAVHYPRLLGGSSDGLFLAVFGVLSRSGKEALNLNSFSSMIDARHCRRVLMPGIYWCLKKVCRAWTEQHQGLFDRLVVCPISWLTRSRRVGLIQNPDGVLAVIASKTDEFLENRLLLRWSTRTISQLGGRNQFLACRHAQSPSHKCHPLRSLMGNKLREATASG